MYITLTDTEIVPAFAIGAGYLRLRWLWDGGRITALWTQHIRHKGSPHWKSAPFVGCRNRVKRYRLRRRAQGSKQYGKLNRKKMAALLKISKRRIYELAKQEEKPSQVSGFARLCAFRRPRLSVGCWGWCRRKQRKAGSQTLFKYKIRSLRRLRCWIVSGQPKGSNR